MARCPKCGYDLMINNDGAYICNNCGSRFRAANNTPAVQPQYTAPQPQYTAPQPQYEATTPVETGKKGKTGKKEKKDFEGVNYGKLQFLAGFFLPLIGIIPGLLIGLATGNRKTIRGMKWGFLTLLILGAIAGIICGILFGVVFA